MVYKKFACQRSHTHAFHILIGSSKTEEWTGQKSK